MKTILSCKCFLNQPVVFLKMIRCLTICSIVLLMVLGLIGCFHDDDDPPPEPIVIVDPPENGPDGKPIDTSDDGSSPPPIEDITKKVEKAMIRIEATVGEDKFCGSGFIIDSMGIAVTNNHVVTGAGIIEVFLKDEPTGRIAELLGYSECSDLAVIDFSNGETYGVLDWYTGTVSANMEVKSAGYPLNAQVPKWKPGTISSSPTPRDTNWASIKQVIEHSAKVNKGNSGGPLVDAKGHVVGINYAANSRLDIYLAIAANEAKQVVQKLRNGTKPARYESIGINGEATDQGIEVRSVLENSPADNIGLMAGDTINRMRNIPLDTGNMNEYCKVIKSNPNSVISIEVTRSGQTLKGQLDMDNMNRGEKLDAENDMEDLVTFRAELSVTDDIFSSDASYYDKYGVTATRSGQTTITIKASAFAPYILVRLLDSQTVIVQRNNSVRFNVTAGEKYVVYVNSANSNKTGSYEIIFDKSTFSNILEL